MHKFFRLVKPSPVKLRSFSFSSSVSAASIRYSIKRRNSDNAFSISGTVREQYTSFRLVGKNYGFPLGRVMHGGGFSYLLVRND